MQRRAAAASADGSGALPAGSFHHVHLRRRLQTLPVVWLRAVRLGPRGVGLRRSRGAAVPPSGGPAPAAALFGRRAGSNGMSPTPSSSSGGVEVDRRIRSWRYNADGALAQVGATLGHEEEEASQPGRHLRPQQHPPAWAASRVW
ncbi:unnamed protein product [Prorocentrum cordatum]|uniref:Uncharacterized protein n=1 Tax=Prorocentrum cordatum TaxID=2364126 RepID=A0ABN9SAI1_9DINO|nr:unnamed protein product [Polarella glacialis]